MSEVNKSVLVSSPGKILIAGGYLVLEGVYSGSVIGSNAKFLVGIKTKEGDDKTITVNSPQFEDHPWNYNFTDAGVVPKPNQSKNPFLDITIPLVYKYLLGLGKTFEELNKGLNLYCFSDNDFYSQVDRLKEANLPQTLEGLSKLEPCGKLSTTLGDVAKTGLGSSATLVTSLVGALLSYHLNLSHLNDHKQIVHNLAQLSHSVAQGKLGSGFDVSAAAFGNQIYSTFQSTWLKSWIQTYSSLTASEFSQTVNNLALWDTKVTSFSLPSGIYLTLADIQHGSHTPSMVTKLLNWRKSNPEVATPIWQGLNKKNLLVTELLIKLQGLYEMDKEGYERSLNWASSISFDKWQENCPSALNTEVIDTLVQIRQTFAQVRSYFRELTEYADVPIEPVEQTQLLNKMEALPGVLIAGVPGAGGYDAVFTLTIGKSPIANLQDLWQANSVIPLLQGGAQQGLGVQLEPKTSDYYNILNSITAANNSQSPPKL